MPQVLVTGALSQGNPQLKQHNAPRRERDEQRVDFGQFDRHAVRARKHRKPAISQSRGTRGPMLERDLIPVPCSTRAGAETAASLARSISGSESIIVIVLA